MVDRTDVNRNTRRQPHWNGKNPAQIPDAAPRSRTALDPVAYDNLIKQHGVRVKVYRSMFCPNVKSVDGGEHNIDCTLCNGSGYLDVDPIESVAYLANQNFQEEMTVEGYHDGNTVGATFLGGVELQYFTRVDLMDFTQPFYERVLRTEGYTPITVLPVIGEFQVNIPTVIVSDFRTSTTLSGGVGLGNFFEVVDSGNVATPLNLSFGHFDRNSGNHDVTGYDVADQEIWFFAGDTQQVPNFISGIVNAINSISTDAAGTRIPIQLDGSGNILPTIRRNCTVSVSGNNIILTQIVAGTSNLVTTASVQNTTSTIIRDGVTEIIPINNIDRLKYDCRRVNVIIDKELNQYYQDIDFILTPQGNIRWIGERFPGNNAGENNIYTVHYESVIQYRTLTAMHINRFAQVPDRSTGLIAQVKMPEQWMMQKEFLIRRRDQFGNEINATGIYGEVIAAQPLNPAPADTLTP